MVTKRQTGAAPRTPRTRAGLCGRCGGHIYHDNDLEADVCRQCNRQAGPVLLTPEEVRVQVLAELGTLYEAGDPAEFWRSYVRFRDLAQIVFTAPQTLQSWFSRNGFKTVQHRDPETGKKATFVRIADAKAVIKARN